jgi:hypothetical protein
MTQYQKKKQKNKTAGLNQIGWRQSSLQCSEKETESESAPAQGPPPRRVAGISEINGYRVLRDSYENGAGKQPKMSAHACLRVRL